MLQVNNLKTLFRRHYSSPHGIIDRKNYIVFFTIRHVSWVFNFFQNIYYVSKNNSLTSKKCDLHFIGKLFYTRDICIQWKLCIKKIYGNKNI